MHASAFLHVNMHIYIYIIGVYAHLLQRASVYVGVILNLPIPMQNEAVCEVLQ